MANKETTHEITHNSVITLFRVLDNAIKRDEKALVRFTKKLESSDVFSSEYDKLEAKVTLLEKSLAKSRGVLGELKNMIFGGEKKASE